MKKQLIIALSYAIIGMTVACGDKTSQKDTPITEQNPPTQMDLTGKKFVSSIEANPDAADDWMHTRQMFQFENEKVVHYLITDLMVVGEYKIKGNRVIINNTDLDSTFELLISEDQNTLTWDGAVYTLEKR